VLMELQDRARADAMRLDELLDTRLAHAHQGKFSRGEKGVRCHQENDKEHPEQYKCNHGLGNSNITKELASALLWLIWRLLRAHESPHSA
jgi:hypothetical protein